MAQAPEWEPGTWYDIGSVVVHQGVLYKIIQAHRSEPGWEPPATPALWGRMQEEYGFQAQQGYGGPGGYARGGGYQPPSQPPYRDDPNARGIGAAVGAGAGVAGSAFAEGYNPTYIQPGQIPQAQAPPGPPPQVQGYGGDSGYDGNRGGIGEKRWDEHQEQQVDIHHEERQKSWHNLDPRRKKQLEVGGGLVAGLALLGGGYYAYKSHHKSEEEKKAQVWALQNWLHDAERRTRDFYDNGPRGPVTWILAEGGRIPDNAIPGGEQHEKPLFICRGFYEGGIQIGKVSPAFEQGAVIGYGHHEIQLPKYEVLVGDRRAVRWVDAAGRLDESMLGAQPVEGGNEADDSPLYVARVHHGHAIIPGKAGPSIDGCLVPVNNTEERSHQYRVLCYA
ncbi:uncharacterized protein FIBRA_00521 [Fibroporia radiculosa]|uniref:Chitin-binding type-3 domain-containing protein n=1 Tax=Fibroporia radiculosa TaxID=599839 RepID=J4HRR4_9APHY|nr:uncharacterized protein FIBRA_00521 [Fibroporia radiculosa]CCL98522.1 predicted protein [Fibroporia radiculosa]